MAFNDTPNKLDAVFVQRTPGNEYYEQINISASNAIVYLNEEGKIDVDRISDWASKYGIGLGGTPETASYTKTASYVPFNGDRPITRDDPDFYGLNVGGEHVVEFLENFFFPFLPATVTISTPSSTLYYETGSVQMINITASITTNNETVFGSGSIRRDGLDWYTTGSPCPFTFGTTDVDISSSHTYRAYVQVGNDGNPSVISSSTRTISFIFPYLYGLSSTPGLEGTTLYSAMVSKSITEEGDKGDYFWGAGTYIYFCYPASYGLLTSILDPNSFELLPSFEHSASVPVTSSGLTNNWQALYHVYRLTLLANPQGYFQFLT